MSPRRSWPLAAVGVLLVAEAASLAVMSFLHLHGDIQDAGGVARPGAAGIAEAVIGVVLLAAAVVVGRFPDRARRAVVAATVFAIAGFVLGISITARGGNVVDIVYHATLIPILLLTLALSLRIESKNTIASVKTENYSSK
jgi:hypothetical protein